MRKIDSIIVHCSATKAGLDFNASDIDRWHRERGFDGIGYHYVIRLNGMLEKGRDIALVGAHCKGWNERSIGICYIGGLAADGNPTDTRTTAQKRVLYQLIMDLQKEYDILQVLGHRDTSPDMNGNGVIEPYEYIKYCPCFDVKEFMKSGRELLFILLINLAIPLLSSCQSTKKIISDSHITQEDSVSTVIRGENMVNKKTASEEMSTLITELKEETTILLPVNDSLMMKQGIIIRNVTQRIQEKETKGFNSETLAKEDFLSRQYKVKVRKEEEAKKETASVKLRNGWWNLCRILCIIIISIACYIRFRRKKGLDIS